MQNLSFIPDELFIFFKGWNGLGILSLYLAKVARCILIRGKLFSPSWKIIFPGEGNGQARKSFHSNTFELIQSHSNTFEPIQTHSDPFEPIRTHSNTFGPIQSHSNTFGPIQTHLDPFEPIRIHSNTFGPIRTRSNPFEHIRTLSNKTESCEYRCYGSETKRNYIHALFERYLVIQRCVKREMRKREKRKKFLRRRKERWLSGEVEDTFAILPGQLTSGYSTFD